MDKAVKSPVKCNMKLVQKNIKEKETNRTKELIAASTEIANKMEPDVKVVEKQFENIIKKTLLLDGLG